jgi:hypothetical protein
MFSAFKLVALTAIASAVELTSLPRPLTAAQAGAFELYMNTTSLNNMVQTLVPILSYYMINNKTIDLDYHSKTFWYKLDMDYIHIDTVNYGPKSFEMEPGTDKLKLAFSGVDIEMQVSGGISLL